MKWINTLFQVERIVNAWTLSGPHMDSSSAAKLLDSWRFRESRAVYLNTMQDNWTTPAHLLYFIDNQFQKFLIKFSSSLSLWLFGLNIIDPTSLRLARSQDPHPERDFTLHDITTKIRSCREAGAQKAISSLFRLTRHMSVLQWHLDAGKWASYNFGHFLWKLALDSVTAIWGQATESAWQSL